MAKKTWTLTDVAQDVYREELAISPADIETPGKFSIAKRRLHGGLRDGVDVIEVDNGRMRFVVVPTRGMGLWRAFCGDVHLGWNSKTPPSIRPSSISGSRAGWDGSTGSTNSRAVRAGVEWFAGNERERDPLPLRQNREHPGANVESRRQRLGRDLRRRRRQETRLFSTAPVDELYTTKIGSGFTVTDTVTNLWAEPSGWSSYHQLGVPSYPGSKAVLPVGSWPHSGRRG